jgi:predicted nuclease of predicted toxin-antitoxin system
VSQSALGPDANRGFGCNTVAKLLVDECLHLSLVGVARTAGHIADHVNYLGLGGSKDWMLMAFILKHNYTFVTNNRSDFLGLYNKASLHAGLIILVPNVTPSRQRELFQAALDHIEEQEPVNSVIEVNDRGDGIECREYPLPKESD